ncbi:hypothetical protein SAMN05421789_103236 [Kaistella chaponensis]|uniref:Uncharacterized protein n=2 Tax=Kaistella chaponensis TaxID=713588 RepID=A0A1N7KJE9_9FLAO|nr:hypothetical protein SAMN05421789_103236 [Kaistella chaponensis]
MRHFMKTPLLTLFLTILSLNLFSQIHITSDSEKNAIEFFDKFYKERKFEKKVKKVRQKNNQIIYVVDGIKFKVNITEILEEKYIEILKSKLINPMDFYLGTEFKILHLEELKFEGLNPKTRRFRVWVLPKLTNNPLTNRINPSEFYFELQSKNDFINLTEYLKNANLTFFQFATIVI